MGKINSTLVALFFLFFFTFIVFSIFGWWDELFSNKDVIFLPYFVFRSFIRMFIAFIFVLIFGLVYGIIAGLYRSARIFMLPLLDILQSIPVLGYLPPAIIFFTSWLPGEIGYEIASLFLIFTGMAWAVVFSIIGAVRNIPNDIREASNAFGIRGLKYVRHIILPAIFPSLITGSILAWGGGWFFLVASEMLTFGESTVALPGIGSFLGKAVFIEGNIPAALFGLVFFVATIFLINSFVWKPLSEYAKFFNFQTMASEDTRPPDISQYKILKFLVTKLKNFEEKYGDKIDSFLSKLSKNYGRLVKFLSHTPKKRRKTANPITFFLIYLVFFVIIMYFFAHIVGAIFSVLPLNDFFKVIQSDKVKNIPIYGIYSIMRIYIALIIALIWTVVVGIIVAQSKFLYSIFMPIFDIGQSTPAISLFPFIVLFVLGFFGANEFSINLASILLLLTGMQWYLLFNIIGAIKSIPGTILEASRAFGLKGLQFYITIVLPAIFPGILLGTIQAWGGAWNSLIVSEYISYSGVIYSVPGLGAMLSEETSSPHPDPWVITLVVACMSFIVLFVNHFLWQPLFQYAEKFRFENV